MNPDIALTSLHQALLKCQTTPYPPRSLLSFHVCRRLSHGTFSPFRTLITQAHMYFLGCLTIYYQNPLQTLTRHSSLLGSPARKSRPGAGRAVMLSKVMLADGCTDSLSHHLTYAPECSPAQHGGVLTSGNNLRFQ